MWAVAAFVFCALFFVGLWFDLRWLHALLVCFLVATVTFHLRRQWIKDFGDGK